LPRYRLWSRSSRSKAAQVVSGTDTLGVGVNIPIRTVLFTQLCKFDGRRPPSSPCRDFLQVAAAPTQGIRRARVRRGAGARARDREPQAGAKEAGGKKVVKKNPPAKGYVHWDARRSSGSAAAAPSRWSRASQGTHGMLLYLLQAEAQTSARALAGPPGLRLGWCECAARMATKGANAIHLRTVRGCFRRLARAGLVRHVRGNEYPRAASEVAGHLQSDFSIHHTLALWLRTRSGLIPRARSYALDVLTGRRVDLENPMPVLWAQLDRAKGEKVAELKAQGLDYAERMEQLEKVELAQALPNSSTKPSTPSPKSIPGSVQRTFDPRAWRASCSSRQARSTTMSAITVAASEGVLLRYLNDATRRFYRRVPEGSADEGSGRRARLPPPPTVRAPLQSARRMGGVARSHRLAEEKARKSRLPGAPRSAGRCGHATTDALLRETARFSRRACAPS